MRIKNNNPDDILNSIGDALIATDLEGKISRMNPAAESQTGYRVMEAMGKSVEEILYIVDLQSGEVYKNLLDQVQKKRRINWKGFSTKLGNASKPDFVISGTITPISSPEGILKGMVMVFRDNTGYKNTDNEIPKVEDQFRQILAFSPIPAILSSLPDGNFIDVNHAAETLIGYRRDELIGHTSQEFDIFVSREEHERILGKQAGSGYDQGAETQIRNRKGNILNCLLYIEIFSFQGHLYSLMQLVDVTEQRRVENSLAENEHNYHELVQNANSAIIRWKTNGEISFFNGFAQDFFGYAVEEIVGKPVSILLPERDSSGDDLSNLVQDIAAHPEKFVNVVNENICRDGRRVWMAWTNKPVYDQNGMLTEILAVGVDITQRKQAEENIFHTERRYRSLIENAPDGIVLIDLNGKFKYASPSVERTFGYTQEELPFSDPAGLTHPDDLPVVLMELTKVINDQTYMPTLTYRFKHKNGNWRWIESRFSNLLAVPEVEGIVINFRDIHERKLAEKKLQTSEARAQALLNAFPDMFFRVNRYGVFLDYKADVKDLHEQSESIVGQRNRDVSPPEFAKLIELKIEDTLTTKKLQTFEYQLSVPGKGVLDFEARMVPSGSDEVIAVVRNITERKKAVEDLRRSEQILRLFVEHSPAAIAMFDREMRYIAVSHRYITDYRLTEQDLTGRSHYEIFPEMDEARKAIHRRCLAGEVVKCEEDPLPRKDGRLDYVRYELRPWYEADNSIGGLIFFSEVITERKQAEVKLRESENHFSLIFRSSPVGINIFSLSDGKSVNSNDSYLAIIGFEKNAVTGHSSDELQLVVMPETRKKWLEYLREGKAIHNQDVEIRRKDGEIRSVLASFDSIEINGEKMGLAFVIDITDRKIAEQKLQQSEERFRQVVEHSQTVIWEVDAKGLYKYVSPLSQQVWGYTPGELIGKLHYYDLHPETGRKSFMQKTLNILKRGAKFEDLVKPVKTSDGKVVFMVTNGIPLVDKDGNLTGYRGSDKDVTDLIKAEEALLAREAELNYAQELAQMSSWRIKLSDQEFTVSKNFRKLIGIEDENAGLTLEYLISRIHPEDAGLMKLDFNSFTPGSPPVVFDFRILMQDGSIKWFQNTMVAEYSEGKPFALKGTSIDITDKKNREEEIRKINSTLEQRITERTAELSDLYNNAPCGYHSLDPDGYFELVNDTELQWLGYTRDELIGKIHAMDLFTDNSKEIFKKVFPAFKQHGKIEGLELDFIRKNGSIISVLLNATAVYDEQARYVRSRSTIIDHTERKKAEESLKVALSNLEAANKELEAFSYSVSHDLRAPLRAIGGFARIITDEYGNQLDDEGKRFCNVILSNSIKMGRLIDDLLAFSRFGRSDMNLVRLNMEPIIRNVIEELTTPDTLQRIRITIDSLPEVRADATLIKQVWINLISNAIKYSSRKDQAEIAISSVTGSKEVTFKIRDNGTGFEMQYVNKLFGVFQRLHTDSEFEGTGVGLAIVKRIISRHGGHVWAEGKQNEGATFYFTIPK